MATTHEGTADRSQELQQDADHDEDESDRDEDRELIEDQPDDQNDDAPGVASGPANEVVSHEEVPSCHPLALPMNSRPTLFLSSAFWGVVWLASPRD